MMKSKLLVCAALAIMATAAFADDVGLTFDHWLSSRSLSLFGILQPLATPATAADEYVQREFATNAGMRLKLAKGLTATYVTRGLATAGDMIAFWPDAVAPTHLIVCIEQGRNSGGTNPGVQRVTLATGAVETIVFGTSACDGIRTTPWGTILFTEEVDDGRAYELVDPLGTTGHWIEDRANGVIRTGIGMGNPISNNIVQRLALPTMAWEGLAILPSGVVIAGDEERPGTSALDADGGAIFKFIPNNPHLGGNITNLNNSPLVAGKVYAFSASCQPRGNSFPQYGQGCEVGLGAWVRVDALTARTSADANGATGYYRPEDLHEDPLFAGPGVRFCWTNTHNEGTSAFGEVICGVDSNPLPANPSEWQDQRTGLFYLTEGGTARSNVTTMIATRFIEGDPRFNSLDNLDFQPHTGNLYVIEDHQFGEVFACLQDGPDRDIKSDGCISILSVKDPLAEPTGFIFDASGEVAYLVIQHGQTPAALGPTDDLIKITGFRIPPKNP